MNGPPPLPASVDPKLARGVVRAETRRLADMEGVRTAVMDAWMKRARPVYLPGRRVEAAQSFPLSEEVAAALLAVPACIHLERRRSPGRALPSKAYRYLAAHFVVTRGDGTAGIATARFRFSQRSCTVAWGASPMRFLEHAAERLLQRLPEDKPRDPLRTIGTVLWESAGYLAATLRIADAMPGKALAVPFGDGLLLGTVQPVGRIELASRTFCQEGRDLKSHPMSCTAVPLVPVDAGLDASEVLTFLAKTYVGPRELRPDQVAFVAGIRALMDRHPGAYAVDGLGCLYPGAPAQEFIDLIEGGLRRPFDDARMDAVHAELSALFDAPGTRKAIGALGPSGGPPKPYWQLGKEASEAHMRKTRDRIEALPDFLKAKLPRTLRDLA